MTTIPGTTSSGNPGHNGTRTVTGNDLRRLNYALSTYGAGATTNVRAAGLAAYVYSITSSFHPGDDVYFFINKRVTNAANNAAVKSQYQLIKANVAANYNKPKTGRKATLDIVMDPYPALTGVVNVVVTPATAPGTLTLTGATVVATGLATAPVMNGSSVPIEAIPTPAEPDLYSVTANATFTAPTTYSSNVRIWNTNNQDAQRIVTAGQLTNGTFSAAAALSDPVAGQFEPIATTQVDSEFVTPGEPMIDCLTADVVDDANFPWRQTVAGDYYSIVARGVLYGPFDEQPVMAADTPPGAPVAGTELLTLTGPGEYCTSGATIPTLSGFYSWVWTIDSADQSARVQLLLPDDYLWVDEFGLEAETALMQATIEIDTQVDDAIVGLWQETADAVTVSHNSSTGAWPLVNGDRVTLDLEGTAYWVPGTTAPAQTAEAPADAVVLDTVSLSVTAPGTYRGPVATPIAATAGYVVWQWKVANSSLYFAEQLEPFGVPSQMVRVDIPRLDTAALPQVALGDPATDTATISGEPMGRTTFLRFRAYLQDPAAAARCDAGNLSFDSGDIVSPWRSPTAAGATEVNALGSYVSPAANLPLGTHYWVATLLSEDNLVIAEGTCGDAREITIVAGFVLKTSATAAVVLPFAATDTATITGPTPVGATIFFEAFKQSKAVDGTIVATCTADTRVFRSSSAPVSGPGTYTSPQHVFASIGTYYWVATVVDSSGDVLETGICGDPAEVTTASSIVPLVKTGADMSGLLAVMLLLLGVGAFLAGSVRLRRRQMTLVAA